MIGIMESCDQVIVESLRCHAQGVEVRGPGRWSFVVGGDCRRPAEAWLEADWLRFRAPLGGGEPRQIDARTLQRMLEANAVLEGGVKFALAGQPDQAVLGAEICPADDPADLDVRIERVCVGIGQGLAVFADTSGALPPLDRAPASADIDLPALCREAEWPFVERGEGQVAVALEVPDVYLSATFRSCGQDRLCVETPLEGRPHEAGCGRAAVGVLLLAACGAVRMARATARTSDNQVQYAWQALTAPVAWELRYALAAISVACRVSAREVNAFVDPRIAGKYLAVRGWCSLLTSDADS
jgi:hypothetical protein